MEIKKYRGSSMQEALLKVKNDLGDDAIILHTKSFQVGGFLGFGGREMYEVVASKEVRIREPEDFVRYEPTDKVASKAPAVEVTTQVATKQTAAGLEAEVREIKHLIEKLAGEFGRASFPPELARYYVRLVELGLSKNLARGVVRKLHDELSGENVKDDGLVNRRLREELSLLVRVTGGTRGLANRVKTVAMIGPTGVGKTTNIAKLCAHFSINEKKRVALITADTYRIAAAEQLRVYADIIGIPMEVVLTPREVKTAVEKYQNRDFIFIDTIGGSQFNEKNILELRTFLNAAGPHETHLVLSATTRLRDMGVIFERFSAIGVDCLLFTKLDETNQRGVIVEAQQTLQKPISYLSTGQNVPDDIEVASVRKIAEMIVGTRNESRSGK